MSRTVEAIQKTGVALGALEGARSRAASAINTLDIAASLLKDLANPKNAGEMSVAEFVAFFEEADKKLAELTLRVEAAIKSVRDIAALSSEHVNLLRTWER